MIPRSTGSSTMVPGSAEDRGLQLRRPGLELRHWPGWLQQLAADGEPELAPRRLERHLLEALSWQQPLVRVYGRSQPVPRLTCWLGDPGCQYAYSGLVHTPEPFTAPLQRLRQCLERQLDCRLNSLLLNRYRNGLDRMGWHADDEPELEPGAAIVSLSLGTSRSLRFRPRPRPAPGQPDLASGEPPLSLELADGELLVMEAPTQLHWQHALPERRRIKGERLNLTFRHIRVAASASDDPSLGPQSTRAMQSISTRAPFGSAATSTQARAGGIPRPNTSA